MATTPCANCGALVAAGTAACTSCGTPTVAIPAPPPAPPGAPPPPPGAPQGFPTPGAAPPGFAAPGAPAYGQPATPPPGQPQPAFQPQPAVPGYHQPAPAGAGASPAEGRNRTAGLLALIGFGLVLLGTLLPIVEFDFGGLAGGVDESLNGWSGDINDGPIHLFFGFAPLILGILVLKNGARTWMKVLLIISAVIGYFWVLVRFADISGSLEEETGAGDFVAEVSDPGIGLYVLIIGWTLVLIAGIVAKGAKKAPVAPVPYSPGYPPPPTA